MLQKAGESAQNLDATLKKLGNTPIGQEAQKSAQSLADTLKQVTDRQTTLAERARLAAQGLEALGGPAKLTKDQLDALNKTIEKGLDAFRALGQDVPPQLQKVAQAVQQQQQALSQTGEKTGILGGLFGDLAKKAAALAGPAAIGFAVKSTLDYADSLSKLADRTGIGVVALQRLEAIAKPSGNSLEEVANAVNRFQKNIAESDEAANGAVQRLGLSFKQLRALSPDEQFIEIAKAIQGIKDPAEQTLLAMQLFGKGGAEILPTLKAKVDELKDSTITMSKESVEALDAVGDAFERLKTSSLNVLGSVIAQLINAKKEFTDLPKGFGNENIGGAQFLDQLNPQEPLKPLGADVFVGRFAQVPAVAAGATAAITAATQAMAAQQAAAERLGLSLDEYQKRLEAVSTHIRALSADTGSLTQAEASRAAALNALGLSEDEISISLGRSSRAIREYFDSVKAGAAAELAFLRELDAQNKLEVDAERATIRLSLAIREHLLPNNKNLTAVLQDLGTSFQRFDGQNEAAAVHLSKTNDNLLTLGTRVTFAKLQTSDFDAQLTELAKSLTRLAQVSGGAFGQIVNQLAGVVDGIEAIKRSADQLGKGLLASFSGGLGLVSGVLGVGGAIFDLFKNIGGPSKDERKARGEQEDFLQTLRQSLGPAATGLSNYDVLLKTVGKSMGDLGQNGEETRKVLAGLLDTRGSAAFEAALAKAQEFLRRAADIKNQVSGNIFGGLSAFAANGTVTTQGSASALSSALGAGVTALQQQGTPLLEIIKQIGPIVTNLQAQFQKAGVSGGEAFDLIQREVALASDEIGGPAIAAINGLGDVLKGLSNIGQLTQSQFTGLSGQIVETFNNLVAQGKDGDSALRLIQPTLQQLFELQDQFVFAVDDGTQALIDQAKAQGIVGEQFKSTQQQTVDALNKTNEILTAIAKTFGVTLPDAAKKGAAGIEDAFNKIQLPDLTVRVGYDDGGGYHTTTTIGGEYGATGGRVMPWGIQPFASGGRVLPFWSRGTDTVPAMLTPGEVVLNAAQQKHLAAALSSPVQVHVEAPLYLDGQVIAKNTVTRIIQDKRGIGTALKQAVA